MEGYGEMNFEDGLYKGQIKNGKPHGKGAIFFEIQNAYDNISYEESVYENGDP